jgi:hypothetical protein
MPVASCERVEEHRLHIVVGEAGDSTGGYEVAKGRLVRITLWHGPKGQFSQQSTRVAGEGRGRHALGLLTQLGDESREVVAFDEPATRKFDGGQLSPLEEPVERRRADAAK